MAKPVNEPGEGPVPATAGSPRLYVRLAPRVLYDGVWHWSQTADVNQKEGGWAMKRGQIEKRLRDQEKDSHNAARSIPRLGPRWQ